MPASLRPVPPFISLLLALAPACGDDGGDTDGQTTGGPTSATGTGDGPTAPPTTDDPTGGMTGPTTVTEPATATEPATTTDPTTGPSTATDPGATDTGETDTGEESCAPALPTFADGKAPTTTLYVQAGAAAGGDGSRAKPFASVQAATGAAQPGTEIRIAGEHTGLTYTEGLQGTDAAPIWFTGEPGAKIGPLALNGASHIVVQDLELVGTGEGHVLHFYFADHIMMRRLKIHEAGEGCIKGSQTTGAYVEDSDLWAAGKAKVHPVLDFVGVNDGHIVRSEFHDGPGMMIMLKGGTSDMLVAWNEIFDQTEPGNALGLGQSTDPIYFQPKDAKFEGLRIVAYANLLHDLVGPPISFEGCKDCAAVRNTIWNTTGAQLVRFLPGKAGEDSGVAESIPEGCRFTGNIVVGGQEGGASLNADEPNTGPNNVIDYNVFLKPGSLNWWGVVAQDMLHSTYDQDPQLSPTGVPGNLALVDGKGPPDLAGLPFADKFLQDAAGACVTEPIDIGAYDVP